MTKELLVEALGESLDLSTVSAEEARKTIDAFSEAALPHKEGEDFWNKAEMSLFKACLHLVSRDQSFEGRRTVEDLISLINMPEPKIKEQMENADPEIRKDIVDVLAQGNDKIREDVRSGLLSRITSSAGD